MRNSTTDNPAPPHCISISEGPVWLHQRISSQKGPKHTDRFGNQHGPANKDARTHARCISRSPPPPHLNTLAHWHLPLMSRRRPPPRFWICLPGGERLRGPEGPGEYPGRFGKSARPGPKRRTAYPWHLDLPAPRLNTPARGQNHKPFGETLTLIKYSPGTGPM